MHVSEGRTVKSFLRFFVMMKRASGSASVAAGEKVDHLGSIRHVYSDMLPAYRKVIAKKPPEALHILDRFHIVANLSKALDEVSAHSLSSPSLDGEGGSRR